MAGNARGTQRPRTVGSFMASFSAQAPSLRSWGWVGGLEDGGFLASVHPIRVLGYKKKKAKTTKDGLGVEEEGQA